LELWVWFRSVRTDRDAAWVCEFAQVLTQIFRESLSRFLRNAVLLVKVSCDLGIRSGKSVFALARDEGSTFNIHVEIAARKRTGHWVTLTITITKQANRETTRLQSETSEDRVGLRRLENEKKGAGRARIMEYEDARIF
jgi:phosphatidate phosphatase APP1